MKLELELGSRLGLRGSISANEKERLAVDGGIEEAFETLNIG